MTFSNLCNATARPRCLDLTRISCWSLNSKLCLDLVRVFLQAVLKGLTNPTIIFEFFFLRHCMLLQLTNYMECTLDFDLTFGLCHFKFSWAVFVSFHSFKFHCVFSQVLIVLNFVEESSLNINFLSTFFI